MSEIYTIDQLNKMPNFGQAQLFIRFLHENDTINNIVFPYIIKKDGKTIHGEKPTLVKITDVLKNGLQNTKNSFGYPIVNLNQPTYISINPIKPGQTRNRKNTAAIKDVYVDIDLHDSNPDQKISQQEAVDFVLNYLMSNVFPETTFPSLVIKTGRGLALHFLYKTAISTDDADTVALHEQIMSDLFARLEDELEPLSVFYCIDTEIDKHVKDSSRITRLPGSVNPKAPKDEFGNPTRCRIVYCDDVRFTLQSLAKAFGLSYELRKTEKSVAKKSSAPKKSETKISQKSESKYYFYGNDNFSTHEHDSFTCDDVRRQSRISYNVRFLKEFFYQRSRTSGWFEGSKRNNFLYILMSHIASVDTVRKAVDDAIYFNERMGEPIAERDFWYTVGRIIEAENNICYSIKRLITDLNITEEELEKIYNRCGHYSALKKQNARSNGSYGYEYIGDHRSVYHRKNDHKANIKRDKLVAYLWLIEKYSASAIARALKKYNEEHKTRYSCSRSTINNVINRLGIRDRSISYEEIDFENLKVYDCYNMAKRSHFPEQYYLSSKNSNKNSKRNYAQEYLDRKNITPLNFDEPVDWKEIEKNDSHERRFAAHKANKPIVAAAKRFVKALSPKTFDIKTSEPIKTVLIRLIENDFYTNTGPPVPRLVLATINTS